jgi:hypothetical protein
MGYQQNVHGWQKPTIRRDLQPLLVRERKAAPAAQQAMMHEAISIISIVMLLNQAIA